MFEGLEHRVWRGLRILVCLRAAELAVYVHFSGLCTCTLESRSRRKLHLVYSFLPRSNCRAHARLQRAEIGVFHHRQRLCVRARAPSRCSIEWRLGPNLLSLLTSGFVPGAVSSAATTLTSVLPCVDCSTVECNTRTVLPDD